MEKIDVVIPWVDGNDPLWLSEYQKYAPCNKGDKSNNRFRDWDLLRYWFRGIEVFAPWANNVFFVTCGQVPEWLNPEAPGLRLVSHADYIPQEYLPVFNSHPIELWMHRIPGLSERFVYFNDDCFLTAPVHAGRFFKNGLPCDMAVQNTIGPSDLRHILLNNIACINRYFNKREVLKNHFWKWFNPVYGTYVLRNLFLASWPYFPGFVEPHFPVPFLRSTFEEVWEKYGGDILQTSMTKFRNNENVSQYLMRDWQLVKGTFRPYNVMRDSVYIGIVDENLDQIEDRIIHQRQSVLVLNDGDVSDFEKAKQRLNACFQRILPNKSRFEK